MNRTTKNRLRAVEIGSLSRRITEVDLAKKEFRVMILKIIQDLRKRLEAQTEKTQKIFNKDLEELKTKQTKVNNKISENYTRTKQ